MNFLIYLLSEGLSKIIPFITVLVIAKFIDVSSFGKLTLYFILYELLIIVISNNITATTRIDYFKLSFKDYVSSKSAHLVVSFIIFIIVLLIGYFMNISYKFVVILALSSLLRTVSSYILSNLQCKEDAKSYGISNLIYIVSMNFVFIGLIILNYGINSWFFAILFGSTMQFFYSLLHIKKDSLILFDKKSLFDKDVLVKEFKNGLVFIPQAIGFWVKLGVDRVLLAHFTSTFIVGYYMFAFQLSLPIIIFSTVINLYMTPKINKFLKINAIYNIEKYLLKFGLLLTILAIADYIITYEIINKFYLDKYRNSLDILIFIIISNLLYSLSLIYMNVFYYIDKKKFISYFVLFIALLQIIMSYIGGELYNLFGIIYSGLFINTIFLLTVIYVLNKNFKRIKNETIN